MKRKSDFWGIGEEDGKFRFAAVHSELVHEVTAFVLLLRNHAPPGLNQCAAAVSQTSLIHQLNQRRLVSALSFFEAFAGTASGSRSR